MSDQGWATLVGLLVVVVMRLLDFFVPRGWIWRGIRRIGERDRKNRDEQ